jgi:hypothetical protein
VEMRAVDQAGFFQHSLEDHFAPVAAGLGLALESAGQISGFAGDSLI